MSTASTTVGFTPTFPCPICGSHDRRPRGVGMRCHGFLSTDRRYAHCSREEHAGQLRLEGESSTFAHRLDGPCRCGVDHRTAQPINSTDTRVCPPSKIVAKYIYVDERGVPRYEVRRKEPKSFVQARIEPDGTRVCERGCMKGVRLVPYHLDELVNAVAAGDRIDICEGEKDVDAARAAGLVATCNPGGAGKWRPEYNEFLRDADVTIIRDRDLKGHEHAEQVAKSLDGIARSIEIREAAEGNDLSDHLTAGRTVEELVLVKRESQAEPESGEGEGLEADGLRFLSEYKVERVDWLWQGRIPLGKLTVGDGDPDLGKSTTGIDIAARLSTGKDMPDGTPGLGTPANSLFLAAEDGIADTILPRFIAAGGDPKRVAILESIQTETGRRPPNLVADLHRIEEHIRRIDARLFGIDPLLAFLVGAEAKSPQDMAETMARLKGVLERTHSACLAWRHFTKGGNSNPLYRGMMSVQILAAARSALYFERHPDDDDVVVVAVSKGNLAPRDQRPSLSYEIVNAFVDAEDDGPPLEVPRIDWQGEVDLSAKDLARQHDQRDSSPKVEACKEFLIDMLEPGPILAKQAWQLIEEKGFSKRIAKEAKRHLKIRSVKPEFGGNWWWGTPEQAKALAKEGS